ncbi:hypothetical protein FACS1894111_11690 [Clostridia bacterium]|nr:hypothetical protein FACS1894111_11690 [Clostridia bacterium]
MIEIIYNDAGRKSASVSIKPPKNIRQIGSPRGRHKIYIEDYAYTFLHSAMFEQTSEKRGAVLLGKSEVSKDIRYTFISGAVSCEDFIFGAEGIVFDESCWEYIYKEMKEYFDNQEVVGWFLSVEGISAITSAIEAAHRKYFTGRDKVLFLSEPIEKEEQFYAYEQGVLGSKEGYYIYYEKNLSMQEYMIHVREKIREQGSVYRGEMGEQITGISENGELNSLASGQIQGVSENGDEGTGEVTDRFLEQSVSGEAGENPISDSENLIGSSTEQALQSYRNAMAKRQANRHPNRKRAARYTAVLAGLIALCVIGINTVNNYEKMKQMEETIAILNDNQKEEKEDSRSGGLVVDNLPGQVESVPSATEEVPEVPATENQTPQPEAEGAGEGNQGAEGGNSQGEPTAGETGAGEGGAAENPEGGNPPPNTEEAAKEQTAPVAAPSQPRYYIVQPGDRLELICKKLYQSTEQLKQICQLNKLESPDKIYAGQKLMLP